MEHSFWGLLILWVLIPYAIQLVSAVILRTDLHLSILLARLFSGGAAPRTTLITFIKGISKFPFWIMRRIEHLLYFIRNNLKLWLADIEKNADDNEKEQNERLEDKVNEERRLTFTYKERYKNFERSFIKLPETNISVARSAFLGPMSDLIDSFVFIINTLAFLAIAALVIFVGKWSMPDVFGEINLFIDSIRADYTTLFSLDSIKELSSGVFESLKVVVTDISLATDWPMLVLLVVAILAVPICSHTHIVEINFKFWNFYPRSLGRILANTYSLFLCTSLLELIFSLLPSAELHNNILSTFATFGFYLDAVLLFEFIVFIAVSIFFEFVVRPIGFFFNLKKK